MCELLCLQYKSSVFFTPNHYATVAVFIIPRNLCINVKKKTSAFHTVNFLLIRLTVILQVLMTTIGVQYL